MDLCRHLGWLYPGDLVETAPADMATLRRFHTDGYLQALKTADESQTATVAARETFNLGTMENPIFPGLFERAATTVSGSIRAAEIAVTGRVAFHPSGGTHHGRPDRASGFCYFNDPVFALLALLDAGLDRVLYLDIDAHHGDGVQDAFAGDSRVWTMSIHEAGKWPNTGGADDRGGGQARNFPVKRGLNDREFAYFRETAVRPFMDKIRPEAAVVTCGADALAGDPLSGLQLSNVALWDAVEAVIAACPRVVVLGGGGYNPWTTARCWTGLWGRIGGWREPQPLPHPALDLLRGLSCDLVDEDDIEPAWLTTIADEPRPGPLRQETVDLIDGVMLD